MRLVGGNPLGGLGNSYTTKKLDGYDDVVSTASQGLSCRFVRQGLIELECG